MPWFNQGLWCGVGKHHFCQVVQVPTWCSFSFHWCCS
jgi:hypothetical protein